MSEEDLIQHLKEERARAKHNIETIRVEIESISAALQEVVRRLKSGDLGAARETVQSSQAILKGDLGQFESRLSELEYLERRVAQIEDQMRRLGVHPE